MRLRNGKTILLVEDEKVTALAEKKMLEKHGYSVVSAYDGEHALNTAKLRGDIDLILMDIDLGPGIDGTETARKILCFKNVPLVFLSSHTEPEIVKKTEDITSYGYIVKDSGETVLNASINMAFKLHDATNESMEKEKLFQSVARNYPNSYLSIIESDYTVGFISGREFLNLGVEPDDFIGKSLEYIFRGSAPLMKKYCDRTFGGEECVFEMDFNGQQQLYKTVPLYRDDGKVRQILAVVENITERKISEKKIRESEERYRTYVENAPYGIFIVNDSGQYIDVNEEACRMTGYRREELLSMSVTELASPLAPPDYFRNLQELKEKGKIERTILIRKKDGMDLPVSLEAVVLSENRYMGYCMDISETVRQQQALKDSEREFKTLFDQSAAGVAQIRPDGTFMRVNARFSGITGFTIDELNSITLFDLIHPDEHDSIEETWNCVMRGERDTSETEQRFIHKNGVSIWTSLFLNGAENESGEIEYAVAVITDNTRQREIEKSLFENETILNEVQEIAGIGSFIWNLKTDVLLWSKNMYTIAGLDPGTFSGNPKETFQGLIHRDDRERVDAEIDEMIKQGRTWHIDFRLVRPGGDIRWVRSGSRFIFDCDSPVVCIGVHHDLTEQKRTAESLNESEEKFRKIYENMAVGIARVSLSFHIEAANPAYCRLLGYSENELVGKHLSEITHPETIAENLRKQAMLGRGEIEHFRLEKKFIHKNGSTVYGVLDANLIRDGEGNPSFFLGSVLDISEIKRIQGDLQRSSGQFRAIFNNVADAITIHSLRDVKL